MNILFSIFLLILAILAGIWLWRKPDWMGFRGKSLWDWMSMLAVPSLIGFGTLFINFTQSDIERVRLQEIALRQYIDRISELSLDERAIAHPQQSLAIGRAQTTAILQIADKERTGRILLFLQEMNLLQEYAVNLEFLDFEGAELKGLQMDNMDMEGSMLRGADLEDSSFRNADLEEADLREADLKNADFRGADFEDALMNGADLYNTDLRGADLSQAVGLTSSQLDDACIDKSTKLPIDITPVLEETLICSQNIDD